MNNMLQGIWKQIRGEAKQQWGKLTDDDLTEINGNMDKLVGKLQEKYGYSQAKAQMEADKFQTEMEDKYRNNRQAY